MHTVRRFDSWTQYVEQARDGTSAIDKRASRDLTKATWRGTATFGDAIKLALDGYHEPVADVTKLVKRIEDSIRPAMRETFEVYEDVTGVEVDVAAFLAGQPESMLEAQPVKVASAGRCVNILVHSGFLASAEASVIKRRGAVVAALASLLETAQHSSEVWLEATCSPSALGGTPVEAREARHTVLIRFKRADEPLDLPRLLFALAHPSNHRRLCFSIREQEPANIAARFGFDRFAMGRTVSPLMADEVEADIKLDSVSLGAPETDDPEAFVREQLDRWGLLAEEVSA